jgi:hypothetical protein
VLLLKQFSSVLKDETLMPQPTMRVLTPKLRIMYTLVKQSGLKKFLIQELPSLILSLFIAETIYKFGSFLLECIAFLATWYVIGLVLNKISAGKSRLKQP